MSYSTELADRLRTQRGALEAAERQLSQLNKAEAKAAALYADLLAVGNESFVHPEALEAHDELIDVRDRLHRQRDAVAALEAEVVAVEGRVGAPQRLQQSTVSLQAARAAVAAVALKRDKINDRIEQLQAQRQAEQDAAAAGRQWQAEVILARVEQREAAAGQRPEHAPDVHESTAALIGNMIDNEQDKLVQLDTEIATTRATVADAEAQVLRAVAAVAEVQLAEALDSFMPVWTRFAAAHQVAFDRTPVPPDFAAIDDDAIVEAIAVLTAEPEGMLKRGLRRVVQAVAA